ncbi:MULTISPECIES: isoleucyl-tRNA synthetase [Achromobacter]|uniref:Isoleucyl-tRNA synthetase n=1 Tax=Achromobacter spanius TaxID=217203 RepID=A0ABY8H104_9BURK|nr:MULTISPECIES: isoleucyl-tRNA synthetase [Achromobacter]WAI85648.1 isoleucyl-tRNA synthetase [Achromobacter spanius]WEX95730.1 isoleucyl-tRNA synthetase [Achromobacter sp. SS2-2022]WFP10550.1 isoleucyl-tRNA synthetase [Achromobacter spanius]
MSAQISNIYSFPAAQHQNMPAQSPVGLVSLLWAAFCQWRLQSRLRNLAADMDPHIMKDMGVPEWLVHESTLQRDLERMRNADYLRW